MVEDSFACFNYNITLIPKLRKTNRGYLCLNIKINPIDRLANCSNSLGLQTRFIHAAHAK